MMKYFVNGKLRHTFSSTPDGVLEAVQVLNGQARKEL
jgi:hypothetical protein